MDRPPQHCLKNEQMFKKEKNSPPSLEEILKQHPPPPSQAVHEN